MKKVRIKTVDGGFCLSVQPFPLFLVAWIRIRNTGTDRSCRIRIQFGSRSTTLVTGSSYQLKFSAKSYFHPLPKFFYTGKNNAFAKYSSS